MRRCSKLNSTKLLLILLLITNASAISLLSNTTEGEMLLINERYVARFSPQEKKLNMGNLLTVYTFPRISVEGNKMTPPEAIFDELEQEEEWKIESDGVKEEVYVKSILTLKEKTIQHRIELENTRASQTEINIQLAPNVNRSYYIYDSGINGDGTYLWLSPMLGEERCAGVAVYFEETPKEYNQIGEISLEKSPSPALEWTINMQGGERKTIQVSYIMGYISNLQLLGTYDSTPPINKQYLLDIEKDPLFDLKNKPSINQISRRLRATTPAEIFEEAKEELNMIPNTQETGTRLLTVTYNFQEIVSKSKLNSIEKALLMREIMREKGIPAELRISRKNELYYGKVFAYPTVKPLAYYPQEEIAQYEEVYMEPLLPQCKGQVQACSWGGELKTDLVCMLNFCVSVYVISILIIIATLTLFFFLQYKAELFYKATERIKRDRAAQKTTDGYYEITDKEYEPDNPLEKAVFTELSRSMGELKIEKYEKKLGYSKLLITTTIEEFEDKGVIKKR